MLCYRILTLYIVHSAFTLLSGVMIHSCIL
nr:MAG TPA: hypothetical protein [Caudoviricetes sp.]